MPWPSSEALLSWPDLLSDPSIMGNTIQKLKRGRASRHLGLEAPLATEEDTLSLGIHQGQPRYFSASGESPWLGAELLPPPLATLWRAGEEGWVCLVGISVWHSRNPGGHQTEVGSRLGASRGVFPRGCCKQPAFPHWFQSQSVTLSLWKWLEKNLAF